MLGNLHGGLANRGLARKAPIGPKEPAPFGVFLPFPCGCEVEHQPRKGEGGTNGTRPGDKRHPSLGQIGRFLFNCTIKKPCCPVCPSERWGLSLGQLSLEGRQKRIYPPAQNQYMQEMFLGNLFLCECMRGLSSHSREYRKIFLANHFPQISQILEGIHFGANTCRACICTRANAGKIPGELFMYWFRARGYVC